MGKMLDGMLGRIDHDREIFEYLTNKLKFSDLATFLTSVFDARVRNLSAKDVFDFYVSKPSLLPSAVPARVLVELDSLLYSVLPADFETVELSNVMPLGLNSRVGRTDQKNVLATVRRMEVLADISTAMALETARVIRAGRSRPVKLCVSQRVLRLQPFKVKGFTPHFRAAAVSTAARAPAADELDALVGEQLLVWVRFLVEARERGYRIEDVRVVLSDMRITEAIANAKGIERSYLRARTRTSNVKWFDEFEVGLPRRCADLSDEERERASALKVRHYTDALVRLLHGVSPRLREHLSTLQVELELDRIKGLGHYCGLCLSIELADGAGGKLAIADGGVTDWTQSLLHDQRETFLVSGLGTELLHKRFGPLPPASE